MINVSLTDQIYSLNTELQVMGNLTKDYMITTVFQQCIIYFHLFKNYKNMVHEVKFQCDLLYQEVHHPSTAGCCFCFVSVSSFYLELFLHSSPVAYWAPTDLGSFSFSVLSLCLFMLFMGFTEVVCHSLLQWTMFCKNSPP